MAESKDAGGTIEMKTILSNSYLLLIIRLFLGCIFIFASIEKISAPEAFATSVEAYKLVPYPLINMFALIIPWLELVCGLLLVVGMASRASAILLSGLLVMFIAGIMLAMFRGLNIDCGCFGPEHASPVGWMKVFEDGGLLLLCLNIIRFPQSGFALEEFSSQT